MSLKSLSYIVFLLLSILVLIFFIFKQQQYKNQVIKVDIFLQNNCELIDSAFMVSTFPEGRNAYFENKKAVMYLKRSSRIQLQASNKYEGFHYSSVPVEVDKNVVLEANCTEEGRLKDIFDSFKEQFRE